MIYQGTIDSKLISEGKSARGKYVRCVFEINGKNYSTFDAEIIKNFKEGDLVEIETETQGKFENMIKMTKIGKIAEKKNNAKQEFHLSIEECRARALEIALKHFSLLVGTKPDAEAIEATAEFYLKFITGENGNRKNKSD